MSIVTNRFDVRRIGMLLSIVALLLLPILLTLPYSSLGHRGMETELSYPDIKDIRMTVGVFSAVALAFLSLTTHAPRKPHPLRRMSIISLLGLLAFMIANAASFFLRGSETTCAYGFPFEFRKWGGGPNIINADFTDYTAMLCNVVLAIVTSLLLGSLQLTMVRGLSRLRRIVVLFSLAAIGYAGVFSSWWRSAPPRSEENDGKQVRIVQLHQNELMSLTQQLWEPAFWVVEHVCGYRYVFYLSTGPDSEFWFEKRHG